jgi:hypothetical protein
MSDPVLRLACTPGGAAARGRRRLRRLLQVLVAILLAAALGAWLERRFWPGAIALVAALFPWTAWRMSGDRDVLGLEIDGGLLRVRMRRDRAELPLAGARARRLSADEIAHLERLATIGGVIAASGGFESHRLGELELFASDLANAVLIESGEERWVVTPDEPERLLAAAASLSA